MDNRQDVFETFEVPDPIRIKKAVSLARKFKGSFSGLKVLECGLAKGGFLDSIRGEGAECFGIDINPRNFTAVTFKQADLNLGFPDFGTKFDLIFAGEVMEHLFDDKKFLKSVNDNLNPEGLIIITVPNMFFSLNRIKMFFGQMPKFAYEDYHYHMYSKKTLSTLLKDANFTLLKVTSSHILFSTRRSFVGRFFEILGDILPSLGAHLIIVGRK
jgi:2-polyprenyl-3-methyl-5-hydroxy-6-metoxy-1,4-benzoquinol methylase